MSFYIRLIILFYLKKVLIIWCIKFILWFYYLLSFGGWNVWKDRYWLRGWRCIFLMNNDELDSLVYIICVINVILFLLIVVGVKVCWFVLFFWEFKNGDFVDIFVVSCVFDCIVLFRGLYNYIIIVWCIR